MATAPKTLYDATVYYRTPSGKLTAFNAMVAANTLDECDEEIQHRLRNAQRFGSRKVAEYVGNFTATIIGKQIETK